MLNKEQLDILADCSQIDCEDCIMNDDSGYDCDSTFELVCDSHLEALDEIARLKYIIEANGLV